MEISWINIQLLRIPSTSPELIQTRAELRGRSLPENSNLTSLAFQTGRIQEIYLHAQFELFENNAAVGVGWYGPTNIHDTV